MSGAELAVVLAGVAVVVAVAVLGAVGVSLSRSLKELRRLLGEIRRDLLPAVQRIEEASGRVTGEVQRVGGLLDVAEAVSERAESLSRVTYRALVEPFAAIASLFRRGSAPGSEGTTATEQVGPGRAAVTPRPPRRASWTRRAAAHLLRSGYRSASARVAARLAATEPRSATAAARPNGGASGSAARTASGGRRSSGGDASWLHQFADAVREVTDEIFEAIEESRRTPRDDRREQERPE